MSVSVCNYFRGWKTQQRHNPTCPWVRGQVGYFHPPTTTTSPAIFGTPMNMFFPTSLMWVGCRENRQEAAASRVGVGHHLQEHLVARGDQGAGLERATEATEPLPVDVTAVNVHVVVAAQVVALQVNKAE